jgi:hypothetical protein
MKKFNKGDQVISVTAINFMLSPYHFENATLRSVKTVTCANNQIFSTGKEIDLSDYLSVEAAGADIVSQISQTDAFDSRGKMLHLVHDKEAIQAHINNTCDQSILLAQKKTDVSIELLEKQIAELQAELASLKEHGVLNGDKRAFKKSFVEDNRKTMLAIVE